MKLRQHLLQLMTISATLALLTIGTQFLTACNPPKNNKKEEAAPAATQPTSQNKTVTELFLEMNTEQNFMGTPERVLRLMNNWDPTESKEDQASRQLLREALSIDEQELLVRVEKDCKITPFQAKASLDYNKINTVQKLEDQRTVDGEKCPVSITEVLKNELTVTDAKTLTYKLLIPRKKIVLLKDVDLQKKYGWTTATYDIAITKDNVFAASTNTSEVVLVANGTSQLALNDGNTLLAKYDLKSNITETYDATGYPEIIFENTKLNMNTKSADKEYNIVFDSAMNKTVDSGKRKNSVTVNDKKIETPKVILWFLEVVD